MDGAPDQPVAPIRKISQYLVAEREMQERAIAGLFASLRGGARDAKR